MRTPKIAPASARTMAVKAARRPSQFIGCAKCGRTGITLKKVPIIGRQETVYYCPLCLSGV